MKPSSKTIQIEVLAERLAARRAAGETVVLCHGVFDLLHIGHIKHLKAAAAQGDVLVVTVTPDQFVNKGPHRPAFPDQLRMEALASLSCVDHVALNRWPTAVETIELLRPDVYVKGMVREAGKRDHTDAISEEEAAVESVGGKMHFTEEETFSASALINRHMNVFTPEAADFLGRFRREHSVDEVLEALRTIRDKRVLVVGETIIDEYQFCRVINKANKEPILAARHLYTERYAGGVLAIANHLAGFCDHVGVLSMLGADDSREEFVRTQLRDNVKAEFVPKPGSPTIVKRRFLEEYQSVKLFEVYVMRDEYLDRAEQDAFCARLEAELPSYDVVVVADYGHGLMTEAVVELVCSKAPFLVVNAQTNAGNRGFNMITRYPSADFISIDEEEARLEARDSRYNIRDVVDKIANKIDCPRFLITRGSNGCLCYDAEQGFTEVPAFAIKLVDRIGAGDAVLALTAPCVAAGIPMDIVGFIGNVAGAEACATIGNKQAIEQTSLFRHISALMQ